jgi:hypothetical protein
MTEKNDSPATAADTSTAPDKLAPFRPLFGMPVAVQFAQQTPYVQVAPQLDANGVPQTGVLPGNRIIGMPSVPEPPQVAVVALGVLRASEDGTWLVIEERIGIPRSAESLGGQALMDVYVRPEMVTHVSFVKSIELRRPRQES